MDTWTVVIAAAWGVLVLLGIAGMEKNHHRAIPPRMRAMREKQRLAENTARLECANEMCEHMVNGEHPQLYVSQNGKRYWRIGPLMWEEGTPCPIQSSAPTADAD